VIFEGKAVIIRASNVDTDVLYPGAYLNIDEPEKMKPYLFEGLDPSLRKRLGPGTILVVDHNFGAGSSREHVPLAMRAWGIHCVLGKSFARIFYRNCFNLGLPAFVCPEVVDLVEMGSVVRLDAREGWVEVDGWRGRMGAVPRFLLEMLEEGGLIPWVRRRRTDARSSRLQG
jgi:3-isopropylmalate/(R)-2-methylmalate dehydratase small subunit